MNRFLRSILAAVLLASSPFAGAVDHFGFIGSPLTHTDDQIATLAPIENVSWIYERADTGANLRALDRAAAAGLKVILDVSAYFYAGLPCNSDGRSAVSFLLPDHRQRWAAFQKAIAPYAALVVAYYTIDEPNLFDGCLYEPDVQAMNDLVRSTTDKPVAVMFLYDGPESFGVSRFFDWVGFHCDALLPGTSCATTRYTDMYRALRMHLAAGQRSILFPLSDPLYDGSDVETRRQVDLVYQIAVADPTAVGIFPFIWSGFSGPASVRPSTWRSFREVGTRVKNGWSYPAGARPVSRFHDTTSDTWFFTESFDEGLNAGLDFQSVAWSVFDHASAGEHPLMRCGVAGRSVHFISREPDCEGRTFERVIGYASNEQSAGTVPLYRFVNPSTLDVLCTTDRAEGAGAVGFREDSILGYVPSIVVPR